MNLQALGLVGLLTRNAPDVSASLRCLTTYFHLHARGAVTELTVDPGLAILSYSPYEPNVEGALQTGDGAVAMMFNIMRTLCGPDFQSIEVLFAHRKPKDVRPFKRFFQVPLRFDAEQFALVFTRDWLDVAVPGSDAEVRRLLQKQIDALELRHSEDFPEIVRSVLRSALLTQHAGADQVAALFSVHPRTLSRRLEAFGVNFQTLVDETRFEIARQMLAQTSLEVGQIASALGYARASVFSRAFRRWSGTTPTQWRAEHDSLA
jgi:AraC-like DNA-binding protein